MRETISFLAQKWRTITDDEDCSKITFLTDCQQLEAVNKLPAQQLLKITVELVDELPLA